MSSSSFFVAKPAIELGQNIINSITETSTKCIGGKEKMVLTCENKEACTKRVIFPWDLKIQGGFHQVKSRQNIQERKM